MDFAFLNAVVIAFVGGVVLNCMPCTFPILSLKIMCIVKRSSECAKGNIADGLLYTVGVMLSMLLLSVVLLILRIQGHVLGWGFQMQSPIVVAVLMYVVFLVGLSFSGLYEIPLSVLGAGDKGSGGYGSFFTGVLSTLIATPCSAPFMVSAVSFAMLQPTLHSVVIFQSMGLGVAFPYLVVSLCPKLALLLPKPGRWMETLRQFLAFPMYIASAWLLHTFVQQRGAGILLPAVSSVVLLALGIWVLRLLSSKRLWVVVAWSTILAFVLSSSIYLGKFYDVYGVTFVKFSQSKLRNLLEQRKSVLLSIGAEWCLMCKMNERVIESKSTQELLSSLHVVYMKADWTNMDAEIGAYLKSVGSSSVPFHVLYIKGKAVEPMPQILRQDMLKSILVRYLLD